MGGREVGGREVGGWEGGGVGGVDGLSARDGLYVTFNRTVGASMSPRSVRQAQRA